MPTDKSETRVMFSEGKFEVEYFNFEGDSCGTEYFTDADEMQNRIVDWLTAERDPN